MIINNETFKKRMLQRQLKVLEDNYTVAYFNLLPERAIQDISVYQKLMRVREGSFVAMETNIPVLSEALMNSKRSILSDYQMILLENGQKTRFLISPVSKSFKRISDMPKDWFQTYLDQIMGYKIATAM